MDGGRIIWEAAQSIKGANNTDTIRETIKRAIPKYGWDDTPRTLDDVDRRLLNAFVRKIVALAEKANLDLPEHPTYRDMITQAISAQGGEASRQAIQKYISSAYPTLPVGAPARITAAIRKGVEGGVFKWAKGPNSTLKAVA